MIFRPDLILIDGTSYIYRAFHALPPLTTSAGKPTGATRGFASMLRKLIEKYPGVPMVMVFDAKGPNFRNDYYKDYKANRPPMPNELRLQIEDIKKLSELFNFTVKEEGGVEADDVIATLTEQFKHDKKILISSPDKDLTQLVEDNVIQHNSMSNEFFSNEYVKEKFGVGPSQVAQLLALVGDKADNIPGITKVGNKTASKWLDTYGNLENIINKSEEITGVVGQNLREEKEVLQRNLFLVSLKKDINLNLLFDDINIPASSSDGLKDFYKKLEFNSFIGETSVKRKSEYKTVTNKNELEELELIINDAECFAFDTETTSLNSSEAELVGVSFSIKKDKGFYIPINHVEQTELNASELIEWLKRLLEINQDKIIGQNLKYDIAVLRNHDIYIKEFFADTMLMSYAVNSTSSRHNLDALAEHYLNTSTIKYDDVVGKGAKRYKNFSEVPIKEATNYAAEDADITLQLFEKLSEIIDKNSNNILKTIDYPLLFVLLEMEQKGALIDTSHLNELSKDFGAKLLNLVKKIHEASGSVFNIDSPKQLSEILFEKLKIDTKGLKKTSTGYFSTSESVLQKLSDQNEIVKDILEYRSLAKLKSTYTDKIADICDQNSRVHTSYHQAVTSTGRLSSSDPNLQNIPIRTKEGITIREAFIAPANKKILAMDYSQIELRLMAHYSQDPIMLNSFKKNEDIHKRTASEIFGTELSEVDDEMRRRAKTINFGLLYGMSAFGLSNQLGVSRAEADIFLNNYFERYSAVKKFMSDIIEKSKETKYVETLYGRKIHVPNISANNYMVRQAAERAAINGPLQGSAADIIKIAMIKIDEWINLNAPEIKMILQVHDELIYEVPDTFSENDLLPILDLMENTTEIDVPLKVEYGFGANWREAH
ncbi:MAG: DNA polymerase I [Gammaproteobacteria bacterium]|nr:DNA polymerase I [Gammaproteobacteria bacterium]|tara:strand:- start:4101 stop:6755 length:2655 start_codon:yes stop_codon:yes gene_type:complete